MRSWRRGVPLRLLVVLCVVTTTACRHDGAQPERLVDESPATEPPVELATIDDPMIATKVDVVEIRHRADGSAAATCLDQSGVDARSGQAVTRIGVDGESVTFRASGAVLHACDGVDRRNQDRWCGRAYGRLVAGRLTDSRLDLTCTSAGGEPVAFAWVEPSEDARFVAVRRRAFVEVYEVAASLPARVSTSTHIDLEMSAATFEISEHDARGAVLRSYTLAARVAG